MKDPFVTLGVMKGSFIASGRDMGREQGRWLRRLTASAARLAGSGAQRPSVAIRPREGRFRDIVHVLKAPFRTLNVPKGAFRA